jgi:imidazole glycerol-phosphate synthase subunit HisF
MLKKRIVATLVVRNGIVVQSTAFKRYLPIGKPAIAVEFLNQWGVDEIILLDISATLGGREPDFSMVRESSSFCFVPLTVGGGITRLDQVKELIRCGADKVCFNQAAIHQPELLSKTAQVFGNQCVVAAIDTISTPEGYRAYDYRRRLPLDHLPGKLAFRLQELGAGEVFINSVDRDGSYQGFDVPLIQSVCDSVSVPVICCGGAGRPDHFVEVFEKTGVSAAAAANFFHFSEHSVTTTKAQVRRAVVVRHDTHADYADSRFDPAGRLLKKDDLVLEDMRFIRIEKEVI